MYLKFDVIFDVCYRAELLHRSSIRMGKIFDRNIATLQTITIHFLVSTIMPILVNLFMIIARLSLRSIQIQMLCLHTSKVGLCRTQQNKLNLLTTQICLRHLQINKVWV